jgi:hypothetical protein
MTVDQNTQDYLDLFGLTLESAETAMHRLEWLDDVRMCDGSALELHFLEQGLAYPDFPEATDAVKRDILVNAEQIHGQRGTISGLLKYVGCFAPIGVTITINPASKKVMELGVVTMGLPNEDMLQSMTTVARPDDCYYLYDPQYGIITVTMPEAVSDAMKEFFQTTLPDELPYGGWDAPSIQLNIVFE